MKDPDLVLKIWYKKDTPRQDKQDIKEAFATLVNFFDNLLMYEITPDCFYEKETTST